MDVLRDAVHVPNCLEFTAILDLLSSEDLDCVSPAMHRGWEDRHFACRRSRVTAREALDVTLDAGEREKLLEMEERRAVTVSFLTLAVKEDTAVKGRPRTFGSLIFENNVA